jgi:hypothetical protein
MLPDDVVLDPVDDRAPSGLAAGGYQTEELAGRGKVYDSTGAKLPSATSQRSLPARIAQRTK